MCPANKINMLEIVDLLSTFAFYPVFCIGLGLCTLYLALSQPWWSNMEGSSLQIYYQKGSKYIEEVIKNCSTLQNG